MARLRPSIERRRRLEKAAARLRPLERQVLVLSAREGLSNAQIAERLQIAPEAIELLLAKALVKLGRALERSRRPLRLW